MRRKTPAQPYRGSVLALHAVDGVGVHVPPGFLAFAIVTERAERRPVEIDSMAGGVEIGADALRDIRGGWPAGVFELIARAVRSSQSGAYGIETMAADLVVRIAERYLADYRSIFADQARVEEVMDCLDVFVRAGWPAAQALTFRLGEI